MLRFDDVTVRYSPGPPPALSAFDLAVGEGEVVALVGPSGAGKSTVLRLAAGLVLPTAGRVETLGVDTGELGRRVHRTTRARVGSIHQAFALVGPLRVANNVAAGRLGRWGPHTAVRSLVRPVEIDEITECLDRVGIADKLWERTDRLSGGQQQRAAIARTLFQGPDLILADEPCSALDPARADAVFEVLASSARSGRAMVASLHDAPLALRHCDRIIGLRQGLVEFDRPAREVDDELLRALYSIDEPSLT